MRRVGGYNIDALVAEGRFSPVAEGRNAPANLAHLLVGSEGTLAFSRRITLELHPTPSHTVLGICHFPRFYDAMTATQRIVELGPAAVELIDRTMIGPGPRYPHISPHRRPLRPGANRTPSCWSNSPARIMPICCAGWPVWSP